MLMATSRPLGLAYFVPAFQMMADLVTMFPDQTVNLPHKDTRKQHASSEELVTHFNKPDHHEHVEEYDNPDKEGQGSSKVYVVKCEGGIDYDSIHPTIDSAQLRKEGLISEGDKSAMVVGVTLVSSPKEMTLAVLELASIYRQRGRWEEAAKLDLQGQALQAHPTPLWPPRATESPSNSISDTQLGLTNDEIAFQAHPTPLRPPRATASPSNSISDTQLGFTNDEIALLRHHQQAAATAGGSSSRAASRASSQGLLLLDHHSLARLSRHFDRLLQQIQTRLEYLSEQSQMVAQQQYDRAGNAIATPDAEIARFHDILRQIDMLEVDFDQIRHIRDVARSHQQRVEEMEQLERSGSSSHHKHSSHHTSSHRRHWA